MAERETVGFIGLGLMGRPMALNLIKAGFTLVVHSRSRGPVDTLAAAGARVAAQPGRRRARGDRRHHDGARLARRGAGAGRARTACSRACGRARC